MHIRFDNRIAFVTGAAQGLGQGIAQALKAAGATVIVADADAPRLQSFARSEGMEAAVFDIGRQADSHAAIASAAERQGRLDPLLAGAGATA